MAWLNVRINKPPAVAKDTAGKWRSSPLEVQCIMTKSMFWCRTHACERRKGVISKARRLQSDAASSSCCFYSFWSEALQFVSLNSHPRSIILDVRRRSLDRGFVLRWGWVWDDDAQHSRTNHELTGEEAAGRDGAAAIFSSAYTPDLAFVAANMQTLCSFRVNITLFLMPLSYLSMLVYIQYMLRSPFSLFRMLLG